MKEDKKQSEDAVKIIYCGVELSNWSVVHQVLDFDKEKSMDCVSNLL